MGFQETDADRSVGGGFLETLGKIHNVRQSYVQQNSGWNKQVNDVSLLQKKKAARTWHEQCGSTVWTVSIITWLHDSTNLHYCVGVEAKYPYVY